MSPMELLEVVEKQRALGLTRAILTVQRKSPLKKFSNRIKVAGIGYGEVCAEEHFGSGYRITAWFEIKDIEKYLFRIGDAIARGQAIT